LSPVIGLAAGGATRTARGGFYPGSAGGGESEGISPPDRHGRAAGPLVACRRGDTEDVNITVRRPVADRLPPPPLTTTTIVTLSREFTPLARCLPRLRQTVTVIKKHFFLRPTDCDDRR